MAFPSDPAGAGVDWEARYVAGDTPWDKGRPHPGLVTWLRSHPLEGRILVPGCGAGHDVRALSLNPQASVIGFDLAPSAIRVAEAFPSVGSEAYRLGDFLQGEAGGGFDGLFEHTCFCAIDPSRRADYARVAAAAVVSGGWFLAIFYQDPGHESGPPFGCTVEELDALFGKAFELVESAGGFETFDGREGRELLRLFLRK